MSTCLLGCAQAGRHFADCSIYELSSYPCTGCVGEPTVGGRAARTREPNRGVVVTLFCVTNEGVPGVRACTVLGQHKPLCPDPVEEGGTCRGCAPMPATVGMLCDHCMSLVEHAYAGWDRWVTLVTAADGRTVTPSGSGSTALGFSNLSLAFLSVDECERHLKTRGDRTLAVWVSGQDGATHAIQFAHAALNAYRTLEVEERERRTPPPARCPHCGLLTHTRNTERQAGAFTVVECQHCGGQLDKIRTVAASWGGSHACESDTALDHIECPDVDCDCWCHLIGVKSRHAGIPALWDADLATAAPGAAPRGEWVITDPHTITRITEERKTA